MRISKRTREEAIEACLCGADARQRRLDHDVPESEALAWDAWQAANEEMPLHVNDDIADECAVLWLEAAALLRGDDTYEPWSPGDPVRLLKES